MGVINIFEREVKVYFQSFIAYVVIAVFLLLAGYFFLHRSYNACHVELS